MNSTCREFLQVTSGLLAFSLSSGLRAAPPTKSPLSLGYSLYGMKIVPLEESLAQCAKNKNYLLPGDGPYFPKYLRMLSDSGYRGPVVVHVSGRFSTVAGYQPIAVAEKCHAAMADALAKAGLS